MTYHFDKKLSTDIGFENRKWFSPQTNKLSVLFVNGVRSGRETVEFLRRMDLNYENVTYDRAWDLNKWGFGDYYDVRASIDDAHVMDENLEEAVCLDKWYDVMVIPAINGWGRFTKKVCKAVEDRVLNGAGLILIQPFCGDKGMTCEELHRMSPLKESYYEGFRRDENVGEGFPAINYTVLESEAWSSKDHYITRGIPFDAIPFHELSFYPYEAGKDSEVVIESTSRKPICAVKKYGKGRVVAFAYRPRDILPQHKAFTGQESVFDALLDNMGGAFSESSFNYLEYFYCLLYRAFKWSAHCEKEVIKAQSIEDQYFFVDASEGTLCKVRVLNEWDNVAAEFELVARQKTMLPESLTYGGRFRFETRSLDGAHITDCYTKTHTIPKKTSIVSFSASCDFAREGEQIFFKCSIENPTEARIEIDVEDYFGRVIDKGIAIGAKDAELIYPVHPQPSMYLRGVASVYYKDHLIDRNFTKKIIIAAEHRKISDYEAFMCTQNRGHGDFVPLMQALYQKLGITGSFAGSSKVLTMSGASGLGIYWYHRKPYINNKEMYLKTKDKKFLVRKPCLNDDSFILDMTKRVQETVSVSKKYSPIAYFANDEGSLTCYTDELDYCFCEHCMTRMRAWLKEVYISLENLNAEWQTHFLCWEEVVPYTEEEAKEKGSYASWCDHRQFMTNTFTGIYSKIKQAVRKSDCSGEVRLSGCQATTAFSGYDYYQLHQNAGYFEAYPSGMQIEFHRSFKKAESVVGQWFGYGQTGADLKCNLWTAVLHSQSFINVFWEYSMMNPDFSFSQSALDMSGEIREIRQSGLGKLLLYAAERDNLKIGIHYSMASVFATAIRDRSAEFQSNRQGIVKALEDLGYQYTFIASQQIEKGELSSQGIKLLILPCSMALSSKETSAIEAFVLAGGILMADYQAGICDEHGKAVHPGRLDHIFGLERYTLNCKPFYNHDSVEAAPAFHELNNFLNGTPSGSTSYSGLTLKENGVRAASAKAYFNNAFNSNIPGFTENRFGEGKAFYFNFSFENYKDLSTRWNGGGGLRALIKFVAEAADIRKPVSLHHHDGSCVESGYECVYYSNDNERYFAVISTLEGGKALGHDGLAIGPGSQDSLMENQINLVLQEPRYLYDARLGQYIGFTDKVVLNIQKGDIKIVASLEEEFQGFDLDVPESVQAGRLLTIQIAAPHCSLDRRRVIALNFYNSTGEYDGLMSQNLIVNSPIVELAIPIPYNAVLGQWTLCTRDAATGYSRTNRFCVSK